MLISELPPKYPGCCAAETDVLCLLGLAHEEKTEGKVVKMMQSSKFDCQS